MADWLKLWTTIHDDPDMRRLSHRAFREYIYAWSWSAKHETDGIYDEMAGLVCHRSIDELIALDRFRQVDPEHYAIRGWDKRQTSTEELERKRARTRERVARYRERTKRPSNSDVKRVSTRLEVEVEEELEVTAVDLVPPTQPLTTDVHIAPRKRDAVFETVAEVCGIDWHELTDTARGSLNKAVAQLRGVHATPDEIRIRASNWPYDIPLTPPSLAKHWPSLTEPKPSLKRSTVRQLTRAEKLEAQGL